jgi:hypothetical protein
MQRMSSASRTMRPGHSEQRAEGRLSRIIGTNRGWPPFGRGESRERSWPLARDVRFLLFAALIVLVVVIAIVVFSAPR